jgi:hypothetical protein
MKFTKYTFFLFLICSAHHLLAQSKVHFAVIGDYGYAGDPERDVAKLVKSWKPEFVITTGDNNYDYGSDSSIDRNIGQYYHEFIYPYKGTYGKGDTVNRFFPSLGNHDWRDPNAAAYLNYFALPGNERYYEFIRGPVHFFVLDSDNNEPDGVSDSSKQAKWLKEKLAASTSPWRIVYFHHAPYSSGHHGNSPSLQWPFKKWGATTVLTGHDHTYERMMIDDLLYLVDGLGGRSLYEAGSAPAKGSKIFFNKDYGALDVTATMEKMSFRFVTRTDSLVDTYELTTPFTKKQ